MACSLAEDLSEKYSWTIRLLDKKLRNSVARNLETPQA